VSDDLFQPFGFPEPNPGPELEESEKRGPVAPWGLPPMANVYQPGGPVYLWLRLLPEGGDLYLEEFNEDEIGVRPRWLDEQISENGLDSIVQHDDWKPDAGSWVYWALTNGIGPGQPFCVEVFPPHWYKSGSYEYEEWDIEWTWNLVRVMPRAQAAAARSWEHYYAVEHFWQERRERAKDRVKMRRELDKSALYLRWFTYFAPGQAYYDDMECPAGVGVQLCSKHTRDEHGLSHFPETVLEGRSNKGDREEALNKLIDQFTKTEIGRPRTTWTLLREHPIGPRISEAGLRSLPQHQG
jgi:hypothetical protein